MYLPNKDNLLAGASRDGQLPPGLNTADNATDLRSDQSPDCYGLDLSVDGKIGKSTIPTGTTRIAKTVTLNLATTLGLSGATAVPFLLHYGRLWNITGLTNTGTSNTIKVGPQNYETEWTEQAADISFAEDANPIIAIVPFSNGEMGVFKTTGSYVIESAYDPRGTEYFRRSSMLQELHSAVLDNVTELDKVLYASNANGLISYKDGVTADLTALVRDSKANFTTLNLNADYIKKRIIASTDGLIGFVYDIPTEKLFRYSGSSFRYTSPEWHLPDWNLVSVDAFKFVVEHGDTTDGTLTYQYRYDDYAWSDTVVLHLDYSEQMYTIINEGLQERIQGHRFQIRVTDLSASKYIKEIRIIGEYWNE